MITSSDEKTSSRLRARRPHRNFVLLTLLLCATLGFLCYVATKNNDLTWAPRLASALRGIASTSRNESNLELALSTTKIQPHPTIDDEVILVDNRKKSTMDLVIEATDSVRNIPSSPYILGEDKDGPRYLHNSSCARFPKIYDLEFNNIYWQTLRTSNGPLYLYGAYFDIRTLNLLGPTLRILAMMDRRDPNVTTYCQIWFKGEKEPVLSQVVEYTIVWNGWFHPRKGAYHPFLLACQVPPSHQNGKVPTSVSLVEQPCDAATNNLRVIFSKPAKKKSFGVCVEALYFLEEDISARLVEWIELLGILGADKIFIYEYALHPNATKVLRYYHQIGRIVLTPFMLPGSEPNEARIRHMYLSNTKNLHEMSLYELVTYNDCFYRNLYNYEYIAVVDIDEVFMPMKGGNWNELMVEVDRKSRLTNKNHSMASYSFRQLQFVDDVSQGRKRFPGIPKYFYMLQNVYRSPIIQAPHDNPKCFHNPERVLVVYHHSPMCLNNFCSNYYVETDLAIMRHYNQACLRGLDTCTKEYRNSTLLDTTIWRYKNELIDRSRHVLGTLGFIPGFKAAKLTTT